MPRAARLHVRLPELPPRAHHGQSRVPRPHGARRPHRPLTTHSDRPWRRPLPLAARASPSPAAAHAPLPLGRFRRLDLPRSAPVQARNMYLTHETAWDKFPSGMDLPVTDLCHKFGPQRMALQHVVAQVVALFGGRRVALGAAIFPLGSTMGEARTRHRCKLVNCGVSTGGSITVGMWLRDLQGRHLAAPGELLRRLSGSVEQGQRQHAAAGRRPSLAHAMASPLPAWGRSGRMWGRSESKGGVALLASASQRRSSESEAAPAAEHADQEDTALDRTRSDRRHSRFSGFTSLLTPRGWFGPADTAPTPAKGQRDASPRDSVARGANRGSLHRTESAEGKTVQVVSTHL